MNNSIGEQLRKAREQRRLTLEQAAFATHIKLVYLHALESDERDLLPSPVQGKGFLRLYAGFLNLEIQPLLILWEGSLPGDTSISNTRLLDKPDIQEDEESESISISNQDDYEITDESIGDESLLEDFEIHSDTQVESSNVVSNQAERYFTQLGLELKKRREILGLQHKDVEKFIHVRAYYLKALEEGRVDDLPSFVQCQGMLSNYAKFLELDVENIMLQFADGLQARRAALYVPEINTSKSPLKTLKSRGKLGKLLSADLVVSGGVIVVLLGFATWAAISVSNVRNHERNITPVSISEILLSTNQSTPLITETVSDLSIVPTSALAEDNIVIPINTPDPNFTQPAPNSSPIQVSVIARQRSWLRIVADGIEVFNDRLVPGNAYPFYASEDLELTSGNAAAIQVAYNQQELGSLGVTGQVVRLTFTLSGISTPTSVPFPTPTPTVAVTSTPTPTLAPVFTPTVTPFIP